MCLYINNSINIKNQNKEKCMKKYIHNFKITLDVTNEIHKYTLIYAKGLI